MNHAGDADELATVRGFDVLEEIAAAGARIAEPEAVVEGGQIALLQVVEDGQSAVGGDVEGVSELVDGPGTGAAVPEEKKRFQMRDGINLLEDEPIDFVPERILFLHSRSCGKWPKA